jgi:hypothetical protein
MPGEPGATLELHDIQSGALQPRPSPYVGVYILVRIADRHAGRELLRRLIPALTAASSPSEGPPRNWGSSGNRRWRGYVVRWIKLLSEVETERAIVDGATNLKQEVRAAS